MKCPHPYFSIHVPYRANLEKQEEMLNMIRRQYNLNLSLVIMFGAMILTLIVGSSQKQYGLFNGADTLAIQVAKTIRSVYLTPEMRAISWISEELGLTIVICVVYWLGYTTETVIFLLALLFGNVINLRMKELFELPRPLSSEISRLYEVEGYGYPSGHSQVGMLYAWLIYAFVQRYWYLCIFAAFLTAASRIYLGVHHFSDTVGGLLCGLGLVAGATGIYGYVRHLGSLRKSLRRSPTLRVLLSLSLSLIYLVVAWGTPDAFKFSGLLFGFFVVHLALDFRWRWRSLPLVLLASIIGLAVLLSVRISLAAILPDKEVIRYFRYFLLGALLAGSPVAFVRAGFLKKIDVRAQQ
jgi:undecaprenyl-diphosphatase